LVDQQIAQRNEFGCRLERGCDCFTGTKVRERLNRIVFA
jgi:hypothetical protein